MWESQHGRPWHHGRSGMVSKPTAFCQASVFCPNGDAVLASVVLETLKAGRNGNRNAGMSRPGGQIIVGAVTMINQWKQASSGGFRIKKYSCNSLRRVLRNFWKRDCCSECFFSGFPHVECKKMVLFFSQRLVLKNIISNNRDIPEVSTLQEQLIRLAAQYVEQAVLEIDRKKKRRWPWRMAEESNTPNWS